MRKITVLSLLAASSCICAACANDGAGALPQISSGGSGVNQGGNSTSNGGGSSQPTGGSGNSNSNSSSNMGGQSANGGSQQVGGQSSSGGSSQQVGGQTSVGGNGSAQGGQATTGGSSAGGSSTKGGTNAGGASAGGTTAKGGTSSGGTSVGGTTAKGGTSSGGTSAGGTSATGGASTDLAKSQCAGKQGPSYEQFFDNTKLATLKVTLAAADLNGSGADQWLTALWAKRTHCSPYSWFKASFSYESPDGIGNVSCVDVGMRLRGSWPQGTTQTQGFKLDMQVLDKTSTTHRRFADLNRINILSIEDDPSHLLQCANYKMMRDFGIPTPLCNHLKVYVNNQYYGVLENVEQINKGFARRHFGSGEGSLYGASPSASDCPAPNTFLDSAAKLAYSGDSFSGYTSQYQLLAGTTAADAEKDLIPMLKCGDGTQTADDAKFKTCISEWIDVPEWLKLIAVESIMPETQSFVGYYRNYFLYFKPDSSAPHGGRFVIWPWDLDRSLSHLTCYPTSCDPFTAVDSLYGPRNGRAKLVTRLTTVFKADYCTTLKSFLSTGYKTTVIDNMAKVIETSVSGGDSTPTAWQAEVTKLHDYINSHATSEQSVINTACQ